MRVAVIGANGFVGAPTCAAFADRGYEVRAVTRRQGHHVPGAHETVAVGDVSRVTDWRPVVTGADAVVYLAARVHVMHEAPNAALEANRDVNARAPVAVARAAAAVGVPSFVYVSTVKVHGESADPAHPVRADSGFAPDGAYARSKVEAEEALRDVAGETGLHVAVVVPPLVYGAGVRANFHRFMRLAMVAKRLPLPLGGVRNARSLVYVGNLADVIVRAAERSASGRFLVDDGAPVSTPDLLRELAAAQGHRARLLTVPVGLLRGIAGMAGRADEVDRLVGSLVVDSAPTRRALDWQPPWSRADGVRATVDWYLECGRDHG